MVSKKRLFFPLILSILLWTIPGCVILNPVKLFETHHKSIPRFVPTVVYIMGKPYYPIRAEPASKPDTFLVCLTSSREPHRGCNALAVVDSKGKVIIAVLLGERP